MCVVFSPAVTFMVQLFCLYECILSFVCIPQQPTHSLIPDKCSSILKNDLVERQLVWGRGAEKLNSSLDSAVNQQTYLGCHLASQFPYLKNLFLQQTLTEYLPRTRHCCKCLGYISEQNKDPAFRELTFWRSQTMKQMQSAE